jgi:hypothetical protein
MPHIFVRLVPQVIAYAGANKRYGQYDQHDASFCSSCHAITNVTFYKKVAAVLKKKIKN